MSGLNATRAERRQLDRDNAKRGPMLRMVPKDEWPAWPFKSSPPQEVYRSNRFLVQIFMEGEHESVLCRLSVCRTQTDGDRWLDGITWDELQQIKNEIGYLFHDAVEVYPGQMDEVNVANMRHLFVMREKLPFAWRRQR